MEQSDAFSAYLVDPLNIQIRWEKEYSEGGHARVYEGVDKTKRVEEIGNRVAVKETRADDTKKRHCAPT